MPSITQQEYLTLTIANIAALTSTEKAAINKYIANGTIWDCLISWGTNTSRVLAYDATDKSIALWDSATDASVSVDLS